MVMWFLKICLTRFLSLLFITNKSYKGSWAPKNWCFWTAVLKTLESPLDCKEIQPVHPKGDQSWVFIGRTDAEAEAPILWSPDVESWLIGKDPDAWRDWGQEEKVTTEDEMAGWHHWLDGHGFGWTLGVGDGQGSLACCGSRGCKKSDTTEQLNWTRVMFSQNVLKYLLHVALPIPMRLFTCIFISSLKSENNHCVCVLVTQLCPALCNPMDCNLPGSSVHGILQARILEWVAMPSSRGSSWPRNQTRSPTLQADSLLFAHKRSKNKVKQTNLTVWNLNCGPILAHARLLFSKEEWFFPRDCLLDNTK